ncbi:MAG TPA: LysM peptidoglycan-binding domain-containing protein, partial [Parafilimonas sp.]
LFNLDATDYTDWAYGLKSAGYATNPSYATSLITTIEKYNLEQYTDVALQQSKQIDVASSDVQQQQDIEFKNPLQAQNQDNQQSIAQNNLQEVNYPGGVFRINQANVLYAKAGTSLFALATQYDIPYKKLLEFNDLDNVDILQQSTLIYLEKKQKHGSKDYHVALPNENLYEIAQEEGVQLESLLAYNNYQKNNQPKPGDKILLYRK